MILPHQTLIRTGKLAKVLGVSTNTLIDWTNNDVRVRNCLFRRGWYSVQRLRDAGLVTRPEQAQPVSGEGAGHVG